MNRERVNRLLMLMLLHANPQPDERAYTKNIREWLEVNSGRPHVAPLSTPAGLPALR